MLKLKPCGRDSLVSQCLCYLKLIEIIGTRTVPQALVDESRCEEDESRKREELDIASLVSRAPFLVSQDNS